MTGGGIDVRREYDMRPAMFAPTLSATLLVVLLALPAAAAELIPTGTLRATYIGTNPVQAFIDPATQEMRGPAAELARALARKLNVPVHLKGAQGVAGVIDSVKNDEADIGFVAYDPARAVDVDFSQTYALAQNTYLVLANSPLKKSIDVDKPGLNIGVGERDAGDFFLTRTLKSATLVRNPGGNLDVAVKQLMGGEIAAYAANRQRLTELLTRVQGLRILPDNFYGVEQAVIVKKGNKALLDVVQKQIDDARSSGLIAGAIKRTALTGVDVAPPRNAQKR
jgi:polar amino acid transport system substrate-binding protein